MVKWKELFEYLEGKEGCNFRGEGANLKWDCGSKGHPRVEAFCKQNNLDFEKVLAKCKDTGGCCCDCEVSFNSAEHISGELEMPRVE